METQGKVIKINKNKTLVVEINRASACGGNCHDCTHTCLSKSQILVNCIQNAKIGDTVIISNRNERVLLLSFLVFILPLIFIIIFYELFSKFISNEIYLSLLSFFGGIIVFLVTILLFRKLKTPMAILKE